jgi:hypothetical protein
MAFAAAALLRRLPERFGPLPSLLKTREFSAAVHGGLRQAGLRFFVGILI